MCKQDEFYCESNEFYCKRDKGNCKGDEFNAKKPVTSVLFLLSLCKIIKCVIAMEPSCMPLAGYTS